MLRDDYMTFLRLSVYIRSVLSFSSLFVLEWCYLIWYSRFVYHAFVFSDDLSFMLPSNSEFLHNVNTLQNVTAILKRVTRLK